MRDLFDAVLPAVLAAQDAIARAGELSPLPPSLTALAVVLALYVFGLFLITTR